MKKALDRMWDEPPAEHPGPWRWVDDHGAVQLQDARGDDILSVRLIEMGNVPPRVRALTEAAPMLHSGVVALLHIISEAHHDGFHFPDDVGPICANLRALTDAIDGRERPKGSRK